MPFHVISGSVFRALMATVPASAQMFRLPPRVAGGEDRCFNSARKIWSRKNAPSGALSSLRGQVYRCQVIYLWLHFLD
jgi:hypothetical protein